MRIKMIVTDLDGTLLYSDETLPKESVDIINRYKEKGVLFVVATSRSVASAQKITDVLNPDVIISSGGAKAVCGENIIYDAEFSIEDSESIIKKCISDKDIEFIRIIGEHIDFSAITACGECCTGCKKKEEGVCKGCIESDGHCEEWAQSKGCPIHKCARKHNVQFCGLCKEFPCKWLVKKVVWRPKVVEELTELANMYNENMKDI